MCQYIKDEGFVVKPHPATSTDKKQTMHAVLSLIKWSIKINK